MWNPENSAELLKALLPNNASNALNDTAQWASGDNIKGRVIKTIMSQNNGNMNGFHPRDLAKIHDAVLSRIQSRRVPFLPNGATCFCSHQCDCSSKFTNLYNVTNINNVIQHALMITPMHLGWSFSTPF